MLETGRTFGALQADPEPALLAIATSVAGEVGGLSFRKAPVGWKQAQGSVGDMQATLYGQIKALRLEILERYGVDLSVHSALFTWLVRHAQWLVNRYLCNAEGATAFERRWRKKYAGFICRLRPYFSASRIRRRAVQLFCREFGLARTRSQISTLLLTAVVFSRPAVSNATRPPGRQTLHRCSL